MQYEKSLVLHCRESQGDYQFMDLLTILNVPKFHPIHLHCFTYAYQMMQLWLAKFPNTHFGITSIIFKNLDFHLEFLILFCCLRILACYTIVREADYRLFLSISIFLWHNFTNILTNITRRLL